MKKTFLTFILSCLISFAAFSGDVITHTKAEVSMLDGMETLSGTFVFNDTTLPKYGEVTLFGGPLKLKTGNRSSKLYNMKITSGSEDIVNLILGDPGKMVRYTVIFPCSYPGYDYVKVRPDMIFIHKEGYPEGETIEYDDGTVEITGYFITVLEENEFFTNLVRNLGLQSD